jgi:ribosomal protein S18 acetylase RimI-like enzyme
MSTNYDGACYTIRDALTPGDLAIAASLFREYALSLDFSLDYQGFEQELASLPGKYGPPRGCILIAWRSHGHKLEAIGCAALRTLDARTCEMKRMFVRPSYRGYGIGRMLAEGLISRAKAFGYEAMRLDSSSDFKAAVGLYQSLGFQPIDRYNDDPLPCTVFMELDLRSTHPPHQQ